MTSNPRMKLFNSNSRFLHIILELKARVPDLTRIRQKLPERNLEKRGIFHQIDTYFQVPKGRLKLREIKGKTKAELIYYERKDTAKVKHCYASILRVPPTACASFKKLLLQILDIKVVVEKVREIYIYKGVEIHLDNVQGLGSFVEFELETSQDPKQLGKQQLRIKRLKEQLEINSHSFERFSYSDLI